MKKRSILWALAFIFLFVLSQDFWGWNATIVLSLWSMPSWIYYFLAIDIMLVIVIWAFTKYFWKDGP